MNDSEARIAAVEALVSCILAMNPNIADLVLSTFASGRVQGPNVIQFPLGADEEFRERVFAHMRDIAQRARDSVVLREP